jgi:hypothetical protein
MVRAHAEEHAAAMEEVGTLRTSFRCGSVHVDERRARRLEVGVMHTVAEQACEEAEQRVQEMEAQAAEQATRESQLEEKLAAAEVSRLPAGLGLTVSGVGGSVFLPLSPPGVYRPARRSSRSVSGMRRRDP